ncbi:MAG: TonB-dependent receptor [Candidatus Tectomicrobia bacterium]|nr:TonB-dependent receptor [Candidatus Tectomicrobia bacterium]
MSILERTTLWMSAVLLAAFAMVSGTSVAQEAGGAAAGPLEEVVVTGTRRLDRTLAESLSPIDVISSDDLDRQGYTELDDLLRTAVPSYQVNSHPIDDAGTLVRPAKLRGLAPDQTLILINGQRRHRSAVINFISDGLTQGVQGPDLSAIPSAAVERVEVLRDGAAAQYGSDAIAGVINFILKEDSSGGSLEASTGVTRQGDGETRQLKGNLGLPLAADGFINLTAEYLEQDETIRSVLRTDVEELIAKRELVGVDASGLNDQTQIWGNPIIHDSLNLFVNAGVPISPLARLYAYASNSEREVEGGFYFRNPDTRNGVFRSGSGQPRLVGALNEATWLSGSCEKYRQLAASASDGAAAVQADFDNLGALAADPDCFSHNAAYPNGFTPRFGGTMGDLSFAGGLEGEFNSGFRYDLSVYQGENEADFFIFNTVNSARGPDQPANAFFDPGTYIQGESSVQADFAHVFDSGFGGAPLHVAFGAEWREETFEVQAADMYAIGAGNSKTCGERLAALERGMTPQRASPCTTEELLNLAGFTPASNGFSGFSPQVAGEWSRYNTSFYVDMETDVSDALSLGAALRFEDYEDFGSTTNGKLAARLRVTDTVGLRGTIQTGFRAPTPGQSNVSNVSTVYNASVRDLVEQGLTPPTDPVAQYYGGQPLQPEESVNYTFGVNWTADSGLTFAADVFRIEVNDRLAPSSEFSLTQEDVDALDSQGIAGVTEGSTLTYYTNSWETETTGVEVVASWNMALGLPGGNTDLTLASSFIETEVVGFDPGTLDTRRVYNIENMLPKARTVVSATHYIGSNWRITGRMSHWGSWKVLDSGRSMPDEYDGNALFDLEFAYTLDSGLTMLLAGQNLSDAYPDPHPRGASDSGQGYHEHSPFGFSGAYWYLRMRYDF